MIYSLLPTTLSLKLENILYQNVFADFENIWFWSDGTSESFEGFLVLLFVLCFRNAVPPLP